MRKKRFFSAILLGVALCFVVSGMGRTSKWANLKGQG